MRMRMNLFHDGRHYSPPILEYFYYYTSECSAEFLELPNLVNDVVVFVFRVCFPGVIWKPDPVEIVNKS